MAWQYLIQLVPAGPDQQFANLNVLGAEGWELIHCAPAAGVRSRLAGAEQSELCLFCVFKRPASPQS